MAMFSGVYNLPTLITLLGLWLSLLSIVAALNHNVHIAVILLMYSGLCDMFDGLVARSRKRSQMESDFGKQLDSLADMANFGVAPAVSGCVMGLMNSWYGILAILIYVTGSAIRLANFNLFGLVKKGGYMRFVGLPTPYTVLFLPWAYLAVRFGPQSGGHTLLALYFALMGIGFVSKFLVPKPQGIAYYLLPIYVVVLSIGLLLI
jgi:CDP-diacylglycerol---serine O-phosphatidyltransferase